jgi:hypothetical protein
MYIFSLSLIIEIDMVLLLWLKNQPEYVSLFTRLMLIDILIGSISHPIGTASQANGKIKWYQIITGCFCFLNFPISLIFLSLGTPAYSIFFIRICLTAICLIIQIIILRNLISISLIQFLKNVIMPIVFTATLR